MNPSLRFLAAVTFVLDHETVFKRGFHGDYQHAIWENVSGDAGGVTKFGIDQRSHPDVDIKTLTLEQARDIYMREYWIPSLAETLPLGFGEVLFDIRVNGGNGPKMLQQALNGYRAPGVVALEVDGDLGHKTLEAAAAVCADASIMRQCLGLLLNIRQDRYDRLARNSEPLRKFLAGWTNRNNDLRKFVAALVA